MLPACTATQKPFYVAYGNSLSYTGDTPGGACKFFVDNTSISYSGGTEHQCATSAGTYPISKLCDDSPQFTVEKMQDMATVWGLFLLAAIVILCARKILNIFDRAPHAEG